MNLLVLDKNVLKYVTFVLCYVIEKYSTIIYMILGVQDINEIPDDYLSQSSVLKHLAKEVCLYNVWTLYYFLIELICDDTFFINLSGVQVKAPSPGSTVGNDTIHDLIGRFDATSFDINNLPTTADYPSKWADKSPLQAAVNNQSKINAEKLALSKSQPDLTSVGILKADFTG